MESESMHKNQETQVLLEIQTPIDEKLKKDKLRADLEKYDIVRANLEKYGII